MKQFSKKHLFITLLLGLVTLLFFSSCDVARTTSVIKEDELFTLNYGNFENEISLYDIYNLENINTRLIMHDGFFYIVNSEAGKILQLTSYGDLIGILYDNERNPVPTFVSQNNEEIATALDTREGASTKIAASYPFNSLGAIAVDNEKNIYVTDFLPIERYENDETSGSILRQVVLRFAADGTFVDFLAQEGLGGQPFPFIKDLHTTNNNELVVVCMDMNGFIVYLFSQEGELLTRFTIDKDMLPEDAKDFAPETYITIENVIPDFEDPILYIKADYYGVKIDESTLVSSGIDFEKTLVYTYDIRTQSFSNPISIPAYEKSSSLGYSTEVFLHPYSFLGVSESGGLFFMIPDDTGLSVLVTHEDSQRIIRRQIEAPLAQSVYQNFSLSSNGIVSALIAYEKNISVSWWRTDAIIDTILE